MTPKIRESCSMQGWRTLAVMAVVLLSIACGNSPVTERPREPAVYPYVENLTDCNELQNELDTAMDNYDRVAPGTSQAKIFVAYAMAADERMQIIGCANVAQSLPTKPPVFVDATVTPKPNTPSPFMLIPLPATPSPVPTPAPFSISLPPGHVYPGKIDAAIQELMAMPDDQRRNIRQVVYSDLDYWTENNVGEYIQMADGTVLQVKRMVGNLYFLLVDIGAPEERGERIGGPEGRESGIVKLEALSSVQPLEGDTISFVGIVIGRYEYYAGKGSYNDVPDVFAIDVVLKGNQPAEGVGN